MGHMNVWCVLTLQEIQNNYFGLCFVFKWEAEKSGLKLHPLVLLNHELH